MKLTKEVVFEMYKEYLTDLRRKQSYTRSKKRSVRMFFDSMAHDDLKDVTKDDILNFAKYLDSYKRNDNKGVDKLARCTPNRE